MALCPLEKPIIRGTSTIDNNQNEKKVVINVNILSKIYQENNLKKSFDIFFDFIHLKINKIRGSIDSINKIKIPKKTFKNMYIYFQKLCSLN
jgi:pimeloyl-CoA synthetase